MESLPNAAQRTVYLMTYSRADMAKFPSRENVSPAVREAWNSCGIRVVQWVVCIAAHSNDCESIDEMNLYHFHMALKLAKRARWLQVRNYLDEKFGIQVKFSDNRNTYYTAYRYVTKQDKDAVHSRGHPDLLDAVPRTEQAITSRKKKAKQKGKGKRKRRAKASEHLSVYDEREIVQAKGITSRLQLVCLAVQQNREGKTSLAQFIANRGNKAVYEAISLAREFSQAESLYLRAGKTRKQLLEEERAGECAAGCDGNWQTAATQLLASQGITKVEFCSAIHTALAKGRGKYQNVFIHGPTNCGKSFILSPLKVIYKAFCNPATGSFAWIGAEDAEIIYLNDFRWHPKIISWADLLLALEGDTVHLPAPKNLSSHDVELNRDTPFFATSNAPIVLVKGGSIDHTNTETMNVRWRFFHFWRQIAVEKQQQLVPCGHCFSRFLLENTADGVTS